MHAGRISTSFFLVIFFLIAGPSSVEAALGTGPQPGIGSTPVPAGQIKSSMEGSDTANQQCPAPDYYHRYAKERKPYPEKYRLTSTNADIYVEVQNLYGKNCKDFRTEFEVVEGKCTAEKVCEATKCFGVGCKTPDVKPKPGEIDYSDPNVPDPASLSTRDFYKQSGSGKALSEQLNSSTWVNGSVLGNAVNGSDFYGPTGSNYFSEFEMFNNDPNFPASETVSPAFYDNVSQSGITTDFSSAQNLSPSPSVSPSAPVGGIDANGNPLSPVTGFSAPSTIIPFGSFAPSTGLGKVPFTTVPIAQNPWPTTPLVASAAFDPNSLTHSLDGTVLATQPALSPQAVPTVDWTGQNPALDFKYMSLTNAFTTGLAKTPAINDLNTLFTTPTGNGTIQTPQDFATAVSPTPIAFQTVPKIQSPTSLPVGLAGGWVYDPAGTFGGTGISSAKQSFGPLISGVYDSWATDNCTDIGCSVATGQVPGFVRGLGTPTGENLAQQIADREQTRLSIEEQPASPFLDAPTAESTPSPVAQGAQQTFAEACSSGIGACASKIWDTVNPVSSANAKPTNEVINNFAKGETVTVDASVYNPNNPNDVTAGGQKLATGGTYNPNAYEAAIQLDMGRAISCGVGGTGTCYAQVDYTNPTTGETKSLIVKVNDNGPLYGNRGIDLNQKSMAYFKGKENSTAVLRNVKLTMLPGNDYTAGPVDASNSTASTPLPTSRPAAADIAFQADARYDLNSSAFNRPLQVVEHVGLLPAATRSINVPTAQWTPQEQNDFSVGWEGGAAVSTAQNQERVDNESARFASNQLDDQPPVRYPGSDDTGYVPQLPTDTGYIPPSELVRQEAVRYQLASNQLNGQPPAFSDDASSYLYGNNGPEFKAVVDASERYTPVNPEWAQINTDYNAVRSKEDQRLVDVAYKSGLDTQWEKENTQLAAEQAALMSSNTQEDTRFNEYRQLQADQNRAFLDRVAQADAETAAFKESNRLVASDAFNSGIDSIDRGSFTGWTQPDVQKMITDAKSLKLVNGDALSSGLSADFSSDYLNRIASEQLNDQPPVRNQGSGDTGFLPGYARDGSGDTGYIPPLSSQERYDLNKANILEAAQDNYNNTQWEKENTQLAAEQAALMEKNTQTQAEFEAQRQRDRESQRATDAIFKNGNFDAPTNDPIRPNLFVGGVAEQEAAKLEAQASALQQQQERVLAGSSYGVCIPKLVCESVTENGVKQDALAYRIQTSDQIAAIKTQAENWKARAEFFNSTDPLAEPTAQALVDGGPRATFIEANLDEMLASRAQALREDTSLNYGDAAVGNSAQDKADFHQVQIARLVSGGDYTQTEKDVIRKSSGNLTAEEFNAELKSKKYAGTLSGTIYNAVTSVSGPTLAQQQSRLTLTPSEVTLQKVGDVAKAGGELGVQAVMLAATTPPGGRVVGALVGAVVPKAVSTAVGGSLSKIGTQWAKTSGISGIAVEADLVAGIQTGVAGKAAGEITSSGAAKIENVVGASLGQEGAGVSGIVRGTLEAPAVRGTVIGPTGEAVSGSTVVDVGALPKAVTEVKIPAVVVDTAPKGTGPAPGLVESEPPLKTLMENTVTNVKSQWGDFKGWVTGKPAAPVSEPVAGVVDTRVSSADWTGGKNFGGFDVPPPARVYEGSLGADAPAIVGKLDIPGATVDAPVVTKVIEPVAKSPAVVRPSAALGELETELPPIARSFDASAEAVNAPVAVAPTPPTTFDRVKGLFGFGKKPSTIPTAEIDATAVAAPTERVAVAPRVPGPATKVVAEERSVAEFYTAEPPPVGVRAVAADGNVTAGATGNPAGGIRVSNVVTDAAASVPKPGGISTFLDGLRGKVPGTGAPGSVLLLPVKEAALTAAKNPIKTAVVVGGLLAVGAFSDSSPPTGGSKGSGDTPVVVDTPVPPAASSPTVAPAPSVVSIAPAPTKTPVDIWSGEEVGSIVGGTGGLTAAQLAQQEAARAAARDAAARAAAAARQQQQIQEQQSQGVGIGQGLSLIGGLIGQAGGAIFNKLFGSNNTSSNGQSGTPTATTPTTPTTPGITLPKSAVTAIANPSTITSGQTAVLSWSAAGPATCSIFDSTNKQIGTGSPNSNSTTPLFVQPTTTSMYKITCTGGTGAANGEVTVTVK